jgi:hypothetical protein
MVSGFRMAIENPLHPWDDNPKDSVILGILKLGGVLRHVAAQSGAGPL